jgi:Abnormal spindle-like microcephaly-assoc'd, ASPM-SPD-2-Hydin/Protein of unknown function (DUF1573)
MKPGSASRVGGPYSGTLLATLLLFTNALWAQSPAVQLTPPSLHFASTMVGTDAIPQTSTLTNTGTANLTITKITANLPFTRASNCPATLVPGASCVVNVTFTPTTSGYFSKFITVVDNLTGGSSKLTVTGTGTIPGAGLSPTSLTFGVVANGSSSSAQSITLTNQGSATLTVNSVTASGDFSQTNNCNSVSSGGTCTINVTFNPVAGGTRVGSLTIVDSDPSSPQIAALGGTGASGTASVEPSSLSFANQQIQTTSASQPITLSNGGSTVLSLFSIVASGDYSQSDNCPAQLAPGANCLINVAFAPSSNGSRTGYITISDSDPTNLQTVTLAGGGILSNSPLTISPIFAFVTPIGTQQFTASIDGEESSDVTWYVGGVAGGNSTVGTISPTGLYAPPSTPGTFVVKAVDQSDTEEFAYAQVVATNYSGTFTFHNDNARDGQNTNETVLTTGNVNYKQFGKLFSQPVDGLVYAQPLYVPAVSIPGQGVHNVVYVVTEHDSIFAYDADSLTASPLWQTSLINPSAGVTTVPASDVELAPCQSVGPEIGITGTPVIDPANTTIYLLARTKEVSGGVTNYVQRLHALDITTGAEQSGSPVVIQASVPGNGEDSVNGSVAFDPFLQNSRVSLLLANGVVYLGWASLCDRQPYHGWVIGYDANTLAQVGVFNTSPNFAASGVWQGGGGIAADSAGNLYLNSANGRFDIPAGGVEWGDTVLKLDATSGLSVADYFTPFNQYTDDSEDLDLGSGGPLLLPPQKGHTTQLLISVGKDGTVYLVNRADMGHFSPLSNSQDVQTLTAALGEMTSTPTYFNNQVYFWAAGDYLKAFTLELGLLSETPVSTGSLKSGYPGAVLSVSANGSLNGIIWALETDKHANLGPAVLRAYDAANISRELYDSTQAGGRDKAGVAVRFTAPTVANGKVYIGTSTEIDVYGLLQ